MAQAGDTIENPVTGERIVFRQTSADTNGELLQFDLYLRARGFLPAKHVHARQEERPEVVSGSVRYRLQGEERALGAGEAVVLPPGIAHTLWNDAEEEAHLIMDVRPALEVETALETMFGLARDGKTNDKGMPNTLHAALLAREYELFLAGPPVAMQRAGTAILAPIARLLGYRTKYREYSR
jgi:quercetin dioxygenase-like cupin family protein